MKTGIRENIEALQRGEALLRQLCDAAYCTPAHQVFQSTVGTHIRHNLDHYTCFLNGLESGCIDYSERQRNTRLEQDRSYALAEMLRVRVCLENIPEDLGGAGLLIETDIGSGRANTSIRRELEFLLSHTTHHYALVAIICQLQGIAVEADFGVAPSTLRYRATRVA